MAQVISLLDVHQSFAAFSEANGATIAVGYSDSDLMIARCVYPTTFEVRPGDTVTGGVAVRATGIEVEVRPYLLRQICVNGAVMMRCSGGSAIVTEACTEDWLTEAFASAGSQEAISAAAASVRDLAGKSLDMSFMLLTFMKHLRGERRDMVKEMILRAMKDGMTGFSLMNAITSVARDTPDPDTRWRLETLGGGLPALLLAGPAARERSHALDLPDLIEDPDNVLQLA